jgi:hypothetical protein
VPTEYDGRRPRIPAELGRRIDEARGQVPFERFVRGMLQAYFDGVEAADVQREVDLDVGPPVASLVSPYREAPVSLKRPERHQFSSGEEWQAAVRAWKAAQ